jgi:hypothetical protein
MLTPNKHSHPDQTVLATATFALQELKYLRAVPYEDLREYVTSKSRGGEFLFVPAMNLLYLLGLVEYMPKADVFEYKGES